MPLKGINVFSSLIGENNLQLFSSFFVFKIEVDYLLKTFKLVNLGCNFIMYRTLKKIADLECMPWQTGYKRHLGSDYRHKGVNSRFVFVVALSLFSVALHIYVMVLVVISGNLNKHAFFSGFFISPACDLTSILSKYVSLTCYL